MDRVTLGTSARPPLDAARLIAWLVCVAVFGLVALAGCGGSKSAAHSKPAYCSARTNLQNSVQQATSLSPSSGIGTLQAEFNKVQTDATTLIREAKSAFPSQTNAIKASVDALKSAVNALPDNPSASQIATVVSSASGVVSAVQSFTDASSSKCG